MTDNKRKIIIPLIILIVGIGVTVYMIKHKMKAKKTKTSERVSQVTVLEITKTTRKAVVFANGTITPAKQIQLKPQVSGNIIKISNNLLPGGFFKKGEVIAQIDNRDYLTKLATQKQVLANAKLVFEQEKARKEVAEKEWDILQKTVRTSDKNKELALRIPQFESAKAQVEAAKNAYKKALLDVERCTLKAPFNCTVLSESVDEGQFVSQASQVAVLAGTDEFWVQVAVPVDSLPFLNLPDNKGKGGSIAVIKNDSGDFTVTKKGKVIRLLGDLTQGGRLAKLLVEIKNPLFSKSSNQKELPLLLGSYVSVELHGKDIQNVAILPRKALRDIDGVVSGSNFTEGFVFLVDENSRLKYKKVKIVWRADEEVFVSEGLNDGDKVITSTIPIPVEGLKLKITKTKKQ
jgi:RND family efflux transporter MFP subunit